MKSFFLSLFIFPIGLFGQTYVKFPTHYDAETTAKIICTGEIKKFLADTIEWKMEKKGDRWVTSWLDQYQINSKVNKIFTAGNPEFSRRTNGGYWFFISVIDKSDESIILKTLKFEVDRQTQKIKTIEIYLK